MTGRIAACAALLPVFLLGCGSDSSDDSFWRVPEDAIRITRSDQVPGSDDLTRAQLEFLADTRHRLLQRRMIWSVGAADGPDHEQWAMPLTAVTDSVGKLYVLDRFLTQIRIFSPDGEFLRSVLSAGDGPLEVRSPTGLAVLPGDTLAVHSSGQAKLFLKSPDGFEYVRDFRLVPRIHAMCHAASGIVTRIAPFDESGTIRTTNSLGQETARYGIPFDHARDDVSALLSQGEMACSGPFVATAFQAMSLLYGYDAHTGSQMWSSYLADFRHPQMELHEGGGISPNYENASQVLGLLGHPAGFFVVQVNHLGPKEEVNGRTSIRVRSRDTYLILAESGAGVFVGEGLPHIIGLSHHTLQAVESDPVPMVIQYEW